MNNRKPIHEVFKKVMADKLYDIAHALLLLETKYRDINYPSIKIMILDCDVKTFEQVIPIERGLLSKLFHIAAYNSKYPILEYILTKIKPYAEIIEQVVDDAMFHNSMGILEYLHDKKLLKKLNRTQFETVCGFRKQEIFDYILDNKLYNEKDFKTGIKHVSTFHNLERLLALGANINDIGCYAISMLTNFHAAPKFDMIQKLLLLGLDINIEDGQLLRYAIRREDTHVLEFLLKHGADPNINNGIVYLEFIMQIHRYGYMIDDEPNIRKEIDNKAWLLFIHGGDHEVLIRNIHAAAKDTYMTTDEVYKEYTLIEEVLQHGTTKI